MAGTALALWAWFGPETVPDHMPDDADREPAVRIDRRRLLAHIRAASALVASAAIWESLSVYAQAASPKRRTAAAAMPPRRSHRPRHKKRKNTPIPKLADGLYLNVKTGTVHAATSQCKTCLIATHPQSLVPTKADDVHWNGRRASASLESVPLRAIANNKPPSAVRLVAAQTTAAVPGPAARQEPHPHAEHRVFMIERHALDLITRGDYLRGAAVLLEAAQSTPTFGLNSNMRLYDLLAGVSVRYALDGHRATLVHNLERELQNVRSLERIAQPARGSAVVSYLYDLAGNDFVHAAAPDNPRPKRSHKPHHHSPKMPGSSASVRAPDSKPKNLPHATYIQRIAADRMAKWRLPIEQVNKTRWGQFWTQPGPIQWAGVQLPALKAAKG